MEIQTIVKCTTTIGLAAGTVGAVVGAVAVTGIAAKVSLAALAVLGLAATWGSVTASFDSSSLDQYYAKLPTHTTVALSTIFSVAKSCFQTISNAFTQALDYSGLTRR